nr:MAG TPA: hypothetical protein [Crassvirales sp.]
MNEVNVENYYTVIVAITNQEEEKLSVEELRLMEHTLDAAKHFVDKVKFIVHNHIKDKEGQVATISLYTNENKLVYEVYTHDPSL